MIEDMRTTTIAIAGVLAACGGGGDGDPDAPPAPDAAIDAAEGCAADELELTGRVRRFDTLAGPGALAEGATVCESPAQDCSTTEATGRYTLCVPRDADVALTFALAGYAAQLYPYTTAPTPTDELDFDLYSDAVNLPIYNVAATGLTYPPTTLANLSAAVFRPGTTAGVPDATLSITPSAGIGPVYGVADDVFYHLDPKPDATTSIGFVEFGDLPTGDYDVFVTHATNTDCELQSGRWPSPTKGAVVRVPVVAGFETYVFLQCGVP
jgi:hypothetical protein